MKKFKNKKLLSAIAVVAVSATALCAALPLSACGDKSASTADVDNSTKVSVINTALGAQVTRTSGTVYYVAPEAKQDGTGESWENPANISTLLGSDNPETATLKAGDTVYVKPGKYTVYNTIGIHASGSYSKYIKIVNAAYDDESQYDGEEKEVVLDFSGQAFASTARGVQIYGNYIYWYGIDVCGAGDNGLYIGGSYNTIEYSEFYNNRDTGLQLGRSYSDTTDPSYNYIDKWPSYNLVKNCTSHNNYDNQTYGENADGFAAKLTVGYANVFDGCIAYRNSDDGWDLYAKTESGNIGTVIMYNCVAYENGYLEYTQRECNKMFPTWNKLYSEDKSGSDPDSDYGLNSYLTRDGDGNGFKLGGSVMDGDVIMYNCLSFNNRMHGVTDNSNPGFISVTKTTSYDNGAVIDDDPASSTFGQIVSLTAKDTHGNINMARQSYSYNNINSVLSVKSPIALMVEMDEYRGSVTDSVLIGNGVANKITGSIIASTRESEEKSYYTSQVDTLVAADVFQKLPIVKVASGYEFNLTGLNDLYKNEIGGALNEKRAHLTFRNEDNSINMGEFLAKKDGVDNALLINGKDIGSTLNLGSWDAYDHFYLNDFVDGSKETEAEAIIARVVEALTISVDNTDVYQNFDVPSRLLECNVEWVSDDTNYVKVGTDRDISFSKAEYYNVQVTRPEYTDVTVHLTANVSIKEGDVTVASQTKVFTLTVKAGESEIGDILVVSNNPEIADNEKTVSAGGRYIIDRYTVFSEPEVKVVNGLYWDGERYLSEDEYTVKTTYKYRPNLNAPAVVVKGFSSSNSGVFEITHEVTLIKNTAKKSTMSYEIYVAGKTSVVDFTKTVNEEGITKVANITVNRDGFTLGGTPTSASGIMYVVVSPTELTGANALTSANIKTNSNVQTYSFKDTKVNVQYQNANQAEYYIYYAIGNLNGVVTSEVYSQKVAVCSISTTTDFNKMAMGQKVGDEDTSTTIYMLTQDLDFTGVNYFTDSGSFKGLFNGAGHTISNINVATAVKNKENCGLFYKVNNGTIENVKFENINIGNGADLRKVGIVTDCTGGYFYNIAMKNINVRSSNQRVAALIGQASIGSPIYIDQISLINDADHKIKGAQRVGSLVGFSQASSSEQSGSIEVYINNCYVDSTIEGDFEIGGIYGTYDCGNNSNCDYNLEITSCVFAGKVNGLDTSKTYAGGILGYHKGAVARMKITKCFFIGEIYVTGGEVNVTSGLKNASGILGSSTSVLSEGITVTVDNNVSLIEEYNTDYGVSAVSTLEFKFTFNDGSSNPRLDASSWNFIYDETDPERETLKAPYVELMFLA